MEKITAAIIIVLFASATFYVKKKNTVSIKNIVSTEKLMAETKPVFTYIKSYKMDIGQADVGN